MVEARSMSELPYMPSHISDEIADTEHLTNEELGAFRRLIRAMWRAGGRLPHDGKLLARYSRSGKRWGAIAPTIMAMMTVAGGEVSFQPLLAQLDLTRNRRQHAVDMGIASGQARAVDKSAAKAREVRSDSHPKYEFRGSLSSRKSLKTNDPTSSTVQLQANNQNQNKYSSSLVVDAAKRLAEGRKASEACALVLQAGIDLLTARVGLSPKDAKTQVGKWLAAVDDPAILAGLVARIEQHDLSGPEVVSLIDAGVRSRSAQIPLNLRAAISGARE
jgi:uncharacterized protein YdaU (DUF1376 family)